MSEPYLPQAGYIAYLSVLSASFLAGVAWFRRLDRPQRLLTVFLGLSVLFEAAGCLLDETSRIALYHFYVPVVFAVHTTIYVDIITNRRIRRVIRYTIPVFVFLSAANTVFLQSLGQTPTYSLLLLSVLMTGYGILYLHQLMRYPDNRNILRDGSFWYTVGNIYYYAISLVPWLLYNFFQQYHMDVSILTTVLLSVGMLYYAVTGIAIYYGRQW